MPTPEPVPEPDLHKPTTFASRRTEREALEASGEGPPPRRVFALRAGNNAENPLLVINHVRA